MKQGVLPFKYEEEKKLFGSTALGGTVLFLDLLFKMNFAGLVSSNLRAKEEKQGWNDLQFLICLMLLNINGGDCVDDVKAMESDDGLRLILKHLEIRNSFGRSRQKLIQKWKWRNDTKTVFPPPLQYFVICRCSIM